MAGEVREILSNSKNSLIPRLVHRLFIHNFKHFILCKLRKGYEISFVCWLRKFQVIFLVLECLKIQKISCKSRPHYLKNVNLFPRNGLANFHILSEC